MATVTAHPAGAVGLTDRGTLRIGQRADVIRFAVLGGTPVLQETWSAGPAYFEGDALEGTGVPRQQTPNGV